MAHFAQIDGNTVTRVIVISNQDAPSEEAGIIFCKSIYGSNTKWLQCSYSGSIRKQFPGAGYTYDYANDVFVAPRPYPSWNLDENHDWQPPIPYPNHGGRYLWDEEMQTWILLAQPA